jgi:F-type H+-transporting ATPase subunit c
MSAKLIGAGLSVIGLGGAGIGIGLLFSGYLLSLSRNPSLKGELFSSLILGFALVEATALFGLLMAFLILFAF